MITLEIVYDEHDYSDVANMYIETIEYVHCISDGVSVYRIEDFEIEGYKYKKLIV